MAPFFSLFTLLFLFLFLFLFLLPLSATSSSTLSEIEALLSLKFSFSDPTFSLPFPSWPHISLFPTSPFHVVSLDLSSLNLSDPIPLRHLNLSNNLLNSSLPPQSHPHPLLSLDLYNNNLSDPLPFPNLTHLHLGGNFFSDNIPDNYYS